MVKTDVICGISARWLDAKIYLVIEKCRNNRGGSQVCCGVYPILPVTCSMLRLENDRDSPTAGAIGEAWAVVVIVDAGGTYGTGTNSGSVGRPR
jgi:hypothetical protein